jgi:NADPH:quinone reductase-like Zn-dependent oxidoreductase
MTFAVAAYAASAAGAPLKPTTISRREVGPRDIKVEIAYAGVCHSDIHTVRDEWGAASYPIVPGHEITGYVTARHLSWMTQFRRIWDSTSQRHYCARASRRTHRSGNGMWAL